MIEELEDRGCRTQVLIASPMGRPIYEREGFRELDRQVRFSIDGLAPDDGAQDPGDPAVHRGRSSDAIVALDRWATGEDRRPVLDALVEPATTLVATDRSGNVRRLPGPDPVARRRPDRRRPRPRRPPARAPPPLDRDQRQGREPASSPRTSPVGRRSGRLAGTRSRRTHRMIRGEPLDWHPEGIFGQFNGALG